MKPELRPVYAPGKPVVGNVLGFSAVPAIAIHFVIPLGLEGRRC